MSSPSSGERKTEPYISYTWLLKDLLIKVK